MSDPGDRSIETETGRMDPPETGSATAPDGAGTPAGGDAAEANATLDARLEAVLFSSDLPLSARRFAALLDAEPRRILEAVDRLNVFYGETGRAFRISPLAGGFQLVTVPDHAELLAKLHKERVPTRLSRAALETLSIIAFKQPVTRSEIDAIRGVSASDRVLRHLIERKLVRISGRAEAPGRPLLYGTTREFLGYFGLSAVSDLPRTDELEALLAGDVAGAAGDDDELARALAESSPAPADGNRGSEIPPGEVGEEHDPREAEQPARMEGTVSDEDPLAEELLEEAADLESHSGEESDDHEGVRSSQ